MLILKRKTHQGTKLTIPPSDKPTVVRVIPVADGRLGFEAPNEVEIVREELLLPPTLPPDDVSTTDDTDIIDPDAECDE